MSVVIPFAGSDVQALGLVEAAGALQLRAGDEVLVVDNRPERGEWLELPPGFEVVHAPLVRSSYHARNAGASRSGGEWVLFLDADCRPPPRLLDAYFAVPASESTGLVAGEVAGVAVDARIIARWLVARRHLEVAPQLAKARVPVAGTANLMIRRRAWAELGGFAEVRSGADYDLCIRAADAGWKLEYRPEAAVEHLHAGGLRAALGRAGRYGAGQAWLAGRRPGGPERPRLAQELGRAVAGWLYWTVTARFERGTFKALDGAWEAAFALGWHRGSNEPRPDR